MEHSGEQRWEELFADLAGQLADQERLEVDAEVADRTRRERALVSWADRVCGHGGAPLVLLADGGLRLEGSVTDVGSDWLLLATSAGEVLVPSWAVLSLAGLGPRARSATTARRFGIGSALRTLARDRATVEVVDRSGAAVTGTIDVVHADAVELSRHEPGEPRRPANVAGRVVVPFAAMSAVRRR